MNFFLIQNNLNSTHIFFKYPDSYFKDLYSILIFFHRCSKICDCSWFLYNDIFFHYFHVLKICLKCQNLYYFVGKALVYRKRRNIFLIFEYLKFVFIPGQAKKVFHTYIDPFNSSGCIVWPLNSKTESKKILMIFFFYNGCVGKEFFYFEKLYRFFINSSVNQLFCHFANRISLPLIGLKICDRK